MKKNIIAIELFCGCGGLTKGLTNAGINVAKGIDADKTAKATYEKNNPKSVFVEFDIRKLSVKDLIEGIDRKDHDLLLAGCAPCQPFSKHTIDSRYDRRKSLMWQFAYFVGKLKPEYLLVENVPGFKKNGNPYRIKFIQTLKKHGYYFDEGIIDAADYGVPQHRRRYVLLGSKRRPVRIPSGAYGAGKRPFKTVYDTIGKYPRIGAGKTHKRIPNHSARGLSETNLLRIRHTPKNGGSRKDVPKEMRLRCHEGHSGHRDVYGRMRWDRPSPTLTCRCNSLSNGRFGHPTQNRAISVREAASIQTFPDSYVFHSYDTNNAMHIGNAVPVLLAEELGRVFTETR